MIVENKFYDDKGQVVPDLTKIPAGTVLKDSFGTTYRISDPNETPTKKTSTGLCPNQDASPYGPRFS